MKRKHMIRACLLLFCLLLCTACRSESKPKETRFSFVSEDSLTIVNAEGQELHFADKVWSGTMPVLDGHFTVDFVPGSTSVQVRFSESFSVRFEPERAKDRSICLSFDGDDFRAVEGPGLQNVEYTRSTVEATGENMQYEVGISTGTRTYLEVTGSGESRVRCERDGKRHISPRRTPRLPSCSGTGPAGAAGYHGILRRGDLHDPHSRRRPVICTLDRGCPQGCHCPPSNEAGPQVCHCEAPQEPWRPERAARRSALGVQSRGTSRSMGRPPANSLLPA